MEVDGRAERTLMNRIQIQRSFNLAELATRVRGNNRSNEPDPITLTGKSFCCDSDEYPKNIGWDTLVFGRFVLSKHRTTQMIPILSSLQLTGPRANLDNRLVHN